MPDRPRSDGSRSVGSAGLDAARRSGPAAVRTRRLAPGSTRCRRAGTRPAARRGGPPSAAGTRPRPAPPRTRRPRSRSRGWPGPSAGRAGRPGRCRTPCGRRLSRRTRRSGRSPAIPKNRLVRPLQAAWWGQSSFRQSLLGGSSWLLVRLRCTVASTLRLPWSIRERPRRMTGRPPPFAADPGVGLLPGEDFPAGRAIARARESRGRSRISPSGRASPGSRCGWPRGSRPRCGGVSAARPRRSSWSPCTGRRRSPGRGRAGGRRSRPRRPA